MGTVILGIVIGTSLWMAFDAHQIGYDKSRVKGMAGMGPAGWLFAGLLLWIVAFPLYVAKRGQLRAAAGKAEASSPVSAASQAAPEAAAKKSLADKLGRGFLNTVYVLGAVWIGLVVYVTATHDDGQAPLHASGPAEAVAQSTPAPPAKPAPAPERPSKLTCPRKEFPSCEAARRIFFQMRNNRYVWGDEAACRWHAAGWFLDDMCGGPG